MIVGIGIDVVEVGRMQEFVGRHEARLSAIFSPSELAYCAEKRAPYQHFAARFAAKEALFKAFGTGLSLGLHWPDVAVESFPSGQPRIVLSGKAKLLAEKLGVSRIHISLSLTGDIASAQVILES